MEICCDATRVLRAPGYRARYETHDPPEDVVGALAAIDRPMTVLLVYGLWCHDSMRIVPGLLRAMASAGNDKLQLLAVHVPYEETDPTPFMAGPVPVRRYPSISFLEGRFETIADIPEGVEKLRFVEQHLDAAKITEALG